MYETAMKNWRFVINRLIGFNAMIASFLGASIGYMEVIVKLIGLLGFTALLILEVLTLGVFTILLAVFFIDMTKDIKRIGQ